MSTRVLANAGVFALGFILIIGGAWGIARGAGYVQLEWGWTSVISGTVALAGGVLTLAIGFVLRRLDALHGALLNAFAGVGAPAPEAIPSAAEPAVAPMPLGIETQPAASDPTAAAVYTDPALVAAQAVNLELLEHEEPFHGPMEHVEAPAAPQPPAVEAAANEPPEIIHAADQGPADDMVKAAGVGDEPELDAAIEQLLAEQRGRTPQQVEPAQTAPAVSLESAAEAPEPSVPIQYGGPEKPPLRAGGWRGLFSRKERRAVPPPGAEERPEEPAWTPEAQERPAAPARELAPAPEPASAQSPAALADSIPRMGDDWFDRALSGLDEVYDQAGEMRRDKPHAGERADVATPEPEVHAPPAEEAPQNAAPSPEPAVIGRYTSGNTTYIMFADGSIEAETPTGILRFASLADLKVYVEGQ